MSHQDQIYKDFNQLDPKKTVSNYSLNSDMSFTQQKHKPQQKQQNYNIVPAINQIPITQLNFQTLKRVLYSEQFKIVLKKFKKYQKDQFYKLAVSELRQGCERQLRRINVIKTNQRQLKKVQIDSEMSMLVIINSIKCLVDLKSSFLTHIKPTNLLKNQNSQDQSMTLMSYQNLRLFVEKSDSQINQFLQNNFYHVNTEQIKANQIKKFFQKTMNHIYQSSSDKIMLSRARLCNVIVILCRILDGNLQQDNMDGDQSAIHRKSNNNHVQSKKKTKSFRYNEEGQQENQNCGSRKSLQHNNNNWTQYSSPDIGLKVNQLSKICEQIPQLQTFLRTLKFSKINLQHRQYFFKIVQILIALHHKVSYLSRNKPALLRQIQYMSMQLSSIHESLIAFICQIQNQMSEYFSICFNKQMQEDSSHQMTELFSFLRRDLMKMSQIIINQDQNRLQAIQKIQRIKQIIYSFYNMASGNQIQKWEQYFQKGIDKGTTEQEVQIINILNQCYVNFQNQLRNRRTIFSDQETERNLEQQVNILLADYQRLKNQHSELNKQTTIIILHRDELLNNNQEKDREIRSLKANLTKKNRDYNGLLQQLQLAVRDHEQFKRIIAELQNQLSFVCKENQKQREILIYGHQDQIRQLIDKINELQRSKTQLMRKYQDQCKRNIRNISGSSSINTQLQYQKDKLEERVKQLEDNQKNYKDKIFGLEKMLQQLKNDKTLLQSELQVNQKNKKKLMSKLQQSESRLNDSFRDTQQKLQDEINTNRQNIYKLQKQLQKYKRNNQMLEAANNNLQNELNQQMKSNNELRYKLASLSNIHNENQATGRQYNQLVDKYQKIQKYNYDLKIQNQQLLRLKQQSEEINHQKQLKQKKYLKKIKELEERLQQLTANVQSISEQNKNTQKLKKKFQNKVFDLEAELTQLQDQSTQKQRTLSSSLQKSQDLRRQLEQKLRLLNQRIQNQKIDNQRLIQRLNQQISIIIKRQKQNQQQFEMKLREYQQNVNFYKNKLIEQQRRGKQLQEESYNISILLSQTKLEKQKIQKRQLQRKQLEQQKIELRKKMKQMQQTQLNLKNQIDRLSLQVDRLKKQMQDLISKLKLRQNQLHDYEDKLNSNQRNIQTKITEQINILISRKQEQLKTSKLKQYEVSKQNKQLQDQIQKLRKINEQLENNINRIAQDKDRVRAELQVSTKIQASERQWSRKHAQSEKSISQYKLTILNFENQRKTLQNGNRNIENINKEISKNLQQAKLKLLQNEQTIGDHVRQINKLRQSLKQQKEQNQEYQNFIKKLKQALSQKDNEIQRLKKRENQLKKQIGQRQLQLQQQKQNVQNAKKDGDKKVQREIKQKQQNQSYYQSLLKNKEQHHKSQLSAQGSAVRKLIQIQYQQKILIQKEILIKKLGDQSLQQLDQTRKKYQKRINQQIDARNTLQDRYRLLAQQIAELKSKNTKTISPTKNNSEQADQLRSELQSVRRQLVRAQGQINRLQKQNINLNSQLTKNMEIQHSLNIIQTKYNHLNVNLKQSHNRISELQTQKASAKLQIQKLKIKNKDLEEQLKNKYHKQQQLNQKILTLQSKLKELKSKEILWRQKQNQWEQKSREQNSTDSRQRSYKETIRKLQQKIKNMQKQLDLKNQGWGNERTQLQNKIFQYKKIELQINNLRNQILVNTDANTENKIISSNYLDLQNRFRQLQIQHNELMRLKTTLQAQKQKILRQNDRLNNQARQVSSKDSQINILKEKMMRINIELTNSTKKDDERLVILRGQFELLQQQLRDKDRQIDSLRQKHKQLSESDKQANLERQTIKNKNKQLSQKINELQKIINQLNQKLSQMQRHQPAKIQEQLMKLKAFYQQQMKKMQHYLLCEFDIKQKNIIQQCQNVLSGFNEDLNSKNNRIKFLQEQIQKLLRHSNDEHKIHEQLDSLNQRYNNQRLKSKELQNKLNQLLSKLRLLQQQAVENKNKNNQLSQININMKEQLTLINKQKQSDSQLAKELNKMLFQKQELERLLQLQERTNEDLIKKINSQIQLKSQCQTNLNKITNQLNTQRQRANQLTQRVKELTQTVNQLTQRVNQLTHRNLQTQQNQSQQIFKIKTELALTRQEVVRLTGLVHQREINIQSQIRNLVNQKNNYFAQISKLREEIQELRNQISRKDNQISDLTLKNLKFKIKEQDQNKRYNQLEERLNKYTVEIQSQRQQFSSISSQGHQLKLSQSRLRQQNQHIFRDNQLLVQQINTLKQHLHKANSDSLKFRIQYQAKNNQFMQISVHITNLRTQLQKANRDRQHLSIQNKNLDTMFKNYKCQFCSQKDYQISLLNEKIINLSRQGQNMKQQIQRLGKQLKELGNSNISQSVHTKSTINLNTKSYVYQGGQVTAQQFMRMQQDLKRLQKQAKQKDQLIFRYRIQITQYVKQITILKQKIIILSEGKTINIKGYTRVTNPKDMSLNLVGRTYSQYDVRQMKAKIEDLQNKIRIYRNRQAELLAQIQKFKFRQKGYADQIKQLSFNQVKNNNSQQFQKSPKKKTTFDKQVSLPLSSTYRMQSQIQNHGQYFTKLEGQNLRMTIQRISTSNHIMGSKIDQLLSNSRRASRFELNQSQIQLVPEQIAPQIRQLIHQNKALIEALRQMKQNREDIANLINQYINPDDLTEFVYRILIYFSDVNQVEAQSIKKQLVNIRYNNTGGFYFTMLQEYTKYILQNNTTQMYKKDLFFKSQQLRNLKKHLEAFLNDKINDSTNLLQRSDSKKSILYKNMSKSRHLSGSRVNQQENKDSRQRPVSQFLGVSNIPGISISAERKASSSISYVPYSQQISQSNQQIKSNSRINITYSTSVNQSLTDRK